MRTHAYDCRCRPNAPIIDQYGNPVGRDAVHSAYMGQVSTPHYPLSLLPMTGTDLGMLALAAVFIVASGATLRRIGRPE